jgi:ankyrin repeat protein
MFVLPGSPFSVRVRVLRSVLGSVLGSVFACSFWVLLAAGGDARLIAAVKSGDAAAAQKLLKAGVPVNEQEADGMTALHWAARQDDEAMVRSLIGAGATASAATRYGVTPLALAAVNGNPRTTQMLLAAGADANSTTPEGETVLMAAARTGNPDVIDRLIAAGARVDDREKWRGETALMWAAGENNAAAVKALLAHGANINAQSKQIDYPEMRLNLSFMATTELPRGGFSPVMFAAREGAFAAASVLADAKANLDLQDPEGTTALMLAIMNVHYDVAVMLIEKGADPNVTDRAAMGALYAVVDMRTMRPLTNLPPRKPSSDVDSLDVVRALIKHGADVNAVLKTPTLRRHHSTGDGSMGEGTTPLMRAARFGDAAAMKVLIESGADPSRRQANGTTALLFASGVGFQIGDGGFARTDRGTEEDAIAAIRLFLDAGADVNVANNTGETPLHAAAARDGGAIIRYLVQRGGKLDAKDKGGRTPLDVARGVPAASGRGGRGGGGGQAPEPGPRREKAIAVLEALMSGTGAGLPGDASPSGN